MIRWVFLLLVALYAGMTVLGQDNGQRRAGLHPPDPPPPQVANLAAPAPAPVTEPPPTPEAKPAPLPTPTTDPETAPALAPATAPAPAPGPGPAPQPPAQPAPLAEAPSPEAPQELRLTGISGGTGQEAMAQMVALQGANMRAGPGKGFAVLASLAPGDLALVLPDDDPALGWRHVRLADGTEGFVAARLLGPAP